MTATTEIAKTKDYVRRHLSQDRWEHTLGVINLSSSLANKYSLDENSLKTAALYHDLAKNLSVQKQQKLAQSFRNGLDQIETRCDGLLHAPASAQKMVNECDFHKDDTVVKAVAYHTTAQPNPSDILKGLFVADFAEPNRTFRESVLIENLVGSKSLDVLFKKVLIFKLDLLLEENRLIHPRSLKLYNQLCDRQS